MQGYHGTSDGLGFGILPVRLASHLHSDFMTHSELFDCKSHSFTIAVMRDYDIV